MFHADQLNSILRFIETKLFREDVHKNFVRFPVGSIQMHVSLANVKKMGEKGTTSAAAKLHTENERSVETSEIYD